MSEPIKWAELNPTMRNALVAEKVLGLRVHRIPAQHYELMDVSDHAVLLNAEDIIIGTIPPYTSSIDAAWLIMDHLKPGRSGPGEHQETFLIRARFVHQLDNMESWWSWSRERLCEAICLAALRSAGVEIDMSEKAEK
jgi:hypothetical protein